MKKVFTLVMTTCILLTMTFTSCEDAKVASQNISKAAHQFEIFRRVVFYNGITDTYILQIEGYCSVVEEGGRLSVIIKTQSGEFLKHYLGLSDNVTYFAEQMESKKVSTQRYRVIFKPSVVVPNIDVE